MKYLALLFLASCSDPALTTAQKGKAIYQSKCIGCHNANPALPGSIGPALQGTPYEVLSFKVVEGTYPDGYKPKRATNIMPKIPLRRVPLSISEIRYLHEYLKDVK